MNFMLELWAFFKWRVESFEVLGDTQGKIVKHSKLTDGHNHRLVQVMCVLWCYWAICLTECLDEIG